MSEEKRWYAIRCLSGKERDVARYLKRELERMKYEKFVEDVVLPLKKSFQVRNGRQIPIERSFMPGYIFVKAFLFDDLIQLVKNVPNAMGFLGAERGKRPYPISNAEMERIISEVRKSQEREAGIFNFRIGDEVLIVEGPFKNFKGQVTNVDMKRQKLEVSVSLFGRTIEMEINFAQAERVEN